MLQTVYSISDQCIIQLNIQIDQDCQWEIHPSIGYYVIVTFEDFQLQNPRYCTENSFYYYSHDYVELLENKRQHCKVMLDRWVREDLSNLYIKNAHKIPF